MIKICINSPDTSIRPEHKYRIPMDDILKLLKLITIVNTVKHIDNEDSNVGSKTNE